MLLRFRLQNPPKRRLVIRILFFVCPVTRRWFWQSKVKIEKRACCLSKTVKRSPSFLYTYKTPFWQSRHLFNVFFHDHQNSIRILGFEKRCQTMPSQKCQTFYATEWQQRHTFGRPKFQFLWSIHEFFSHF